MKKKCLVVLQIIGAAVFVLGVFQFKIGFFIGFLCTGLFFYSGQYRERESLGMATSIIAISFLSTHWRFSP
ncbi:hypothetical protein [Rossellomorea aquimaris]|uniref:hypothetical protein n=1 Tax=Rossellomorea aquimaris TaxID=189382 RepID=UPI002494BD0D|nr:hypothetical protein [Rossellomorea aquimaris]